MDFARSRAVIPTKARVKVLKISTLIFFDTQICTTSILSGNSTVWPMFVFCDVFCDLGLSDFQDELVCSEGWNIVFPFPWCCWFCSSMRWPSSLEWRSQEFLAYFWRDNLKLNVKTSSSAWIAVVSYTLNEVVSLVVKLVALRPQSRSVKNIETLYPTWNVATLLGTQPDSLVSGSLLYKG